MSAVLIQTVANAVLLIGITLIAGSIGLKPFEAIDRRFEAMEGRIETLRSELKRDITLVDTHVGDVRSQLRRDVMLVDAHVGEVRTELVQTRSDLTSVALAVGAHRAEGST